MTAHNPAVLKNRWATVVLKPQDGLLITVGWFATNLVIRYTARWSSRCIDKYQVSPYKRPRVFQYAASSILMPDTSRCIFPTPLHQCSENTLFLRALFQPPGSQSSRLGFLCKPEQKLLPCLSHNHSHVTTSDEKPFKPIGITTWATIWPIPPASNSWGNGPCCIRIALHQP